MLTYVSLNWIAIKARYPMLLKSDRFLLNCYLQEEPTDAGSPRLQYWELTEELCILMGLSKTKLSDFLVKQGVNSLGKFLFM